VTSNHVRSSNSELVPTIQVPNYKFIVKTLRWVSKKNPTSRA